MSVSEVTARISEIRARIAVLGQGPALAGTTFASALAQAGASSRGITATTQAAGLGAAAGSAVTGSSASGSGAASGSGPASGLDDAVPFAPLFTAAAARHGVDASLLAAIARQESSFDPNAVSRAGAQGLMQLMPSTARSLGVDDPFDPAQAVDGAARLLKDLLREFGSTELALAAYNAGPGAVHRYNGIPPYPETQAYVRRIMSDLEAS